MPRKNPQRNGSPLYWSAESWAIITLRLFLGLQILNAGLAKFKGGDGAYAFSNYYDNVVPWIIGTFAEKTNLWGLLVSPYAYAIAYLEILIGLLVLAGVKTKYALALLGLTLVSLAFGQMLLGADGATAVSQIAILLMMNAAALYFVRHNKLEALR